MRDPGVEGTVTTARTARSARVGRRHAKVAAARPGAGACRTSRVRRMLPKPPHDPPGVECGRVAALAEWVPPPAPAAPSPPHTRRLASQRRLGSGSASSYILPSPTAAPHRALDSRAATPLSSIPPPPPTMSAPNTSGGAPRVTLRTSMGSFAVELYVQHAPRACRNFVELVQRGYYDGTVVSEREKGGREGMRERETDSWRPTPAPPHPSLLSSSTASSPTSSSRAATPPAPAAVARRRRAA